jgi:hypothetical protein
MQDKARNAWSMVKFHFHKRNDITYPLTKPEINTASTYAWVLHMGQWDGLNFSVGEICSSPRRVSEFDLQFPFLLKCRPAWSEYLSFQCYIAILFLCLYSNAFISLSLLVTKWLYGTKHYWIHRLCSHSMDSQHIMEVHQCLHNSTPTVLILIQTNAIHITPFSLYKIHLNVIHPHKFWYSQISLLLTFLPIIYLRSSMPIRATILAHLFLLLLLLLLLDFIILIILGRKYKSRYFSLYSVIHPPVTSSLFLPNFILSTLFSNIINLYTSINVKRPRSALIQKHR